LFDVSSSIFWIGTIVKSNSELACVETAAEAENVQGKNIVATVDYETGTARQLIIQRNIQIISSSN